MSLNTSLKGRLRNTTLPKTHVLFPLFEAVVNSIHSIDERIIKQKDINIDKSYIRVRVLRSDQLDIQDNSNPDIIGFEIIDNGIGFNDENFNSFQTLDSEYKIVLGGRGVGRLLWLKSFNKVSVSSTYKVKTETQQRSFDFNIKYDLHKLKENNVDNNKLETVVELQDLKKEYNKYMPKTSNSIAMSLLEHCLWYFLRIGGAPNITIFDDGESFTLNDLYDDFMLNASDSKTFEINSVKFDLTHVKLKSRVRNKNSIIYSAANRVVLEESLNGKIPGLFGSLKNGYDSFNYMCFVTSDFLTERVNPERIGFNISESEEGLFKDQEITFCDIRKGIIENVAEYLDEYLEENKKIGLQRMSDFVDNKAPRYRPILGRIDENNKVVDPNISDKDLDIKLHRHLMEFETELLSEGHDLMKPNETEDEEEYSERIKDYLLKVNDQKRSDLANYVTHRKVILDLLGKAIEIKKDGKYSKEEVLHNLIMPMQKTSNELFADDSNLWLIDERLAFHNFLSSDKTINSMPITDSESKKEPDLLSLNIYDNPLLVNDSSSIPLASITVVEIKRPMRNDAKQGEEKDPIEQALGYLKRVRNGKVTTASGRLIPNSETIPGFCYVIADITDSLKTRCETKSLQVTADGMGYFGYNLPYKTYIEVISFDRLLNMAKERNKAFFDKLGLPTT
ncbi:MAG: sensor histidine kinase [Melioribacteraceae bacterium]|nr:sensor histidine kinase [Melioribacteraceae bacterium]